MRSKWFLFLILAIVGLTVGFTVFRDDEAAYEIVEVKVGSGEVVMTVETLGTVDPLSNILVGCETTGKIIEIAVDNDEPVAKDQVICRIDPELAEAQHQQSVAELIRAKSARADAELAQAEQAANLPVATAQALGRLREAEASLVAEEYNWQRIDDLYKKDDASKAEWTATKARYLRAKAAVEIAKAAHELAKNNERFLPKRAAEAVAQAVAAEKLAQARFETTQAQVDRCIIRSPIDGIVLKRFMDLGATVNATFQTPPLFMIAPSLDRMRVNAKVSESDIVHIDVGQEARFVVEGRQRSEFHGRILKKRNQPEVIQGVTTYTVIFEVQNDERHTLLPGMSVNVEIACVRRPDATRIANAALRFNPPISLEERRALCDAAASPPQPLNADGSAKDYCNKVIAWRFDRTTETWQAVPLWVGITDNVHTEILAGAVPGGTFVKKFVRADASGFSLKEAMKLASPGNRRL
ncbi:MAG: HlyD family secretion protein [Phycisphaerae bacterium]